MTDSTNTGEPNLEEVFRSAIQSEANTRQSYLWMSELVKDEAAKAKLRDLADRELVHRATLERRYRELFHKDPPPLGDAAPTIPPIGVERMTVSKVLKMALEHERNSESDYRFLAEKTTDPHLRNAFNELAEIEWKHKSDLELELARSTNPDEFLFDV